MSEQVIDKHQRPVSIAEAVAALLAVAWLLLGATVCACVCGCVQYRGGRVVDGSNIAIGITIPGTEWTINALDYVGGIRVCGNDATSIKVTNEVDETNSYFGVVTTSRRTKMSAKIEPTEQTSDFSAGSGKTESPE